MATITAIRCTPAIKVFYDHLIVAGKARKLTITACMRKLLVILTAMVRDNSAWEAARHLQTAQRT